MKIAILQVGSVEQNVLEQVQESIPKVFPRAESMILKDSVILSSDAYDCTRRQYHSSFLLTVIGQYLKKTDAEKILGITTGDLYVPQLNFVFGEAELSGRAAIISLHRLESEFYGESANQAIFLERASKEAIHEVGHTFGLEHCSNPSCVMSFSHSIRAVDTKKQEFCPKCSKRLSELIR